MFMRLFARLRIPLMLAVLLVFVVGMAWIEQSGLAVHAAGASASITLTPNIGPPTTVVTVNGTGFGVSETVTINFDTKSLATTTTSSTGTFLRKINVPSSALPGNHTVKATGQTSKLVATALFVTQTNWVMFGYGPQHTHLNPYENVLSPNSFSHLVLNWS